MTKGRRFISGGFFLKEYYISLTKRNKILFFLDNVPYSVKADSLKDRWLQAVNDDGLMWQQVSDLKGWGNEVVKEYAVNSIPANFLVNSDGVINI